MKKIYDLLFEDVEIRKSPEDDVTIQGDLSVKARTSNKSIDDQIDALILKYEKDSIKEDEKGGDSLYESLKHKNLKYLLEQEEDVEPAEEDEEAGGAEETPDVGETTPDDPGGSEDVAGDISAASNDIVPNLDVDAFTKKIIRLLQNYRSLIRIEDVIINRAKNFLDENYGDAFVTKFIEALGQYGLEVSDIPKADLFLSDKSAPYAIGANPAGAQMSGGA